VLTTRAGASDGALVAKLWSGGSRPVSRCDRQGSNLRRLALQASALPAELRSRGVGSAPKLGSRLGFVTCCFVYWCPHSCERGCSSHSPTLRPWIARSRWLTRVLRGGVLEPGSHISPVKMACVTTTCVTGPSSRGTYVRPFSLRRGLNLGSTSIQAEHHLLVSEVVQRPKKRATHLGRPRSHPAVRTA
jgi:hypothetical protein